MTVIDLKAAKEKKKEENKEEVLKEDSVDFEAIRKANEDRKKKEAEDRIKKNKQVLRNYDIKPKK
jgi:hypothetical protein